jgi:hypothetical protein
MALIACGECGREVSDKAVSCPHCGAPINRAAAVPVKPQKTNNIGCFTTFVVIVGALWLLSQCTPDSSRSTATSQEASPTPAAPAMTPAESLADLKARWNPAQPPRAEHATMLELARTLAERHSGTPEAVEAQKLIEPIAAKVEEFRKESAALVAQRKWTYSETVDEMTSKKITFASVRSENTIELDFPYQGAQHARLMFRRKGSDLDALFFLEKGQILCGSYDGCTIDVRFDEAAPTKFRMLEPDDNSTETLFFSDPARLLSKLEAADKVLVSVTLYQAGTHTFEFDASGFQPESFKR